MINNMTDANRNDLLELSASLIEVASGRELALAERLQANLETAAEAMAAARAEPYVEGSTGQLRAHPGFSVAARCDEIASRLYGQLTADQGELLERVGAELGRTEPPRLRAA